MKYKTTIKTETEIPFEVDVPSYWKSEYSFYRVCQRGEPFPETKIDIVHDWHPLNKLEFHTNQPISLLHFEKAEPITKQEFETALEKVIQRLDEIANEMNPENSEDSFWHYHRDLYPLRPANESYKGSEKEMFSAMQGGTDGG